MFPGLSPDKMEKMMKKLGMQMDNIQAKQVVIKTESGDIKIDEPQVIKTTMKGQVVFQISGNIKEEKFSEDDIKLVMDQTGEKNKDKIRQILKETNGDIVEAIMKLKGD